MGSRALLLVIVPMLGCTSYSTMQTARTLKPGQVRGYFAPSLYSQQPPPSVPLVDWQRYGTSVMEFGARFGIKEDLDIGAKLWTFGVAMDAKFQLVRSVNENRGVDLAIAPGLGAQIPGTGAPDWYLPLLIGLNFGQGHSFVFGPKASASFARLNPLDTLLLGTSLGASIKTAPKLRLMPELTLLYPVGDRLSDTTGVNFRGQRLILQLGFGFHFDR